jgi:hypothetical protein
LQVQGTEKDQLINDLIPLVESDYLAIRNKPFDVGTDGNITYPDGAELTAIKMIGFHINSVKGLGINSETIGDYTIEYEKPTGTATINGYPAVIVGTIKRFRNKVTFV